ncbi:MAG: 4-(cytidine 5'-diphospho)-2-C-methyl-D-erythritol kinase [Curvibacter sp.]|nr:4-(cytidine 5'-diphospho)-2-C-methyl-D-erythritol kinase [Curvibacter sp.]
MKAIYDVPAPAKLNLFLHITGRRPDGYHLLQSVFMLIDWCDTLHFELRQDGQISREDLAETLPADDLCVRAARLLKDHAQVREGAHIGVLKRVPSQAGMGGGSSDAASTLLALNRLWKLRLGTTELAALALKLGADVPFFIHGRNAWVEGIGDIIRPLTKSSQLPKASFIVVKPQTGLETAKIFSAPELERDKNSATIEGFAADHYRFGENSLQPVAQRLCPEVTQAIEWLEHQGLNPRMTGSGSAVFAYVTKQQDLEGAPAPWQIRYCSNMEVHPLWGWATSDSSSVGV